MLLFKLWLEKSQNFKIHDKYVLKYMISMYYKDNVDDVIAKAAQLF